MPHEIPFDLISQISKSDIFLLIRVHPKLSQNDELFQESIRNFKKQLKNYDLKLKNNQIIFSNPYITPLWSDILKTNGLATLNSSSYRYAKILGYPAMVYSNLLNRFDNESYEDMLYGFANNFNPKNWEYFIQRVKKTEFLDNNKFNNIINNERKKIDTLIKKIVKDNYV